MSWAGGVWTDESLIFAVADPEGHPCDVGPLANLERPEVEELHAAIGQWLKETAPDAP